MKLSNLPLKFIEVITPENPDYMVRKLLLMFYVDLEYRNLCLPSPYNTFGLIQPFFGQYITIYQYLIDLDINNI